MQRIVFLVGAIAAAWVVIYVAFWLPASGCFAAFTMVCANAPYEPLRAFFMLDWVYGYQTLLGGVLAIVGAGGVVWSTMVQRNWAIQDQIASRAEATLAAITSMRMAFQRAYNVMVGELTGPPVFATSFEPKRARMMLALDEVDQSIAQAERLGSIAELLQFAASTMRDEVRGVSGRDSTGIVVAAGISACVGAYLADADRLVDDHGRARHVSSKRQDLVKSVLSRLGYTPETFGPKFPTLAAMFTFD
jgi:hypothetical protein